MKMVYMQINKKWFEEHKDEFYKTWKDESGSEEEDEQCYTIDLDEVCKPVTPELELQEITKDGAFVSTGNTPVYLSFDWKPSPSELADLLEYAIDDIQGEPLTKVIEVVVKKLNKLRNIIESIKGL